MQCVLLCGGLGTRLQPVVNDRPKPMADIEGKPFMYYIVNHLKKNGYDEIIFANGYLGHMIEDYFGDGSEFGIKAHYSRETSPLGTAGALKKAFKYISDDKILVMNADSYSPISFQGLYDNMKEHKVDVSICTRKVPDVSRFGEVVIVDGKVHHWNEKSRYGEGYINRGIYLIKTSLILEIPEGKASLEEEMMPKWVLEKRVGAIHMDGYFIDIGIPEDLEKFRTKIRENS